MEQEPNADLFYCLVGEYFLLEDEELAEALNGGYE